MGKYYEQIMRAKERQTSGLLNSIPWAFPRLTQHYNFPGWVKSKYMCVSANSSIGKTQITKYLVLFSTFKAWVESKYSFDFVIKWYALEESEEEFWFSLLCFSVYIQTEGKVNLFPRKILGQTKYVLSESETKLILETEKNSLFFNTMLEKVEIITTIRNPTGILRDIEGFFNNPNIGSPVYEEGHEGNQKLKGYNYNNPELYVFGVLDHISLLREEKNHLGDKMTKHQTLGMMSQDYILHKFCRIYGMTWINVHQQSAENEHITLYKGQIVEDTLFPSLDNLAKNRELQQEYDNVIGLYNPSRFGLETSFGYPYQQPNFNDGRSFRWMGFLKDRLAGLEGMKIPLYFTGSNPYFEELPTLKEIRTHEKNINLYPTH